MLIIKKPVLCNYYLTYRCNAACSFCDIWERPSPYANLETIKENFTDLKRLGVKIIDFTGGEPLLHREIGEILQIAKDMGFITTLTTNCLLYPKKAESIRGLVDMLHFSLDSPIREEHNESRKVDCFGHFLRSIEIARELGERPDVLFTVFPGNIHRISQVYEDITLPNNLMLILNPVFEYKEVGESLGDSHLQELIGWGKKKLVYINKGFLTLRQDGGNNTSAPSCKATTSSIVISPENKLLLPCYHLEKYAIPIEGKLYDIYKNHPHVQISKKLEGKFKECEGCVVNCYFQPSFAVNVNKYFFHALPSTLKYMMEKKFFFKAF